MSARIFEFQFVSAVQLVSSWLAFHSNNLVLRAMSCAMLTGQVDAFDVRSGMNPCSGMQPGKIYVGGEQDRPAGSSGCGCASMKLFYPALPLQIGKDA